MRQKISIRKKIVLDNFCELQKEKERSKTNKIDVEERSTKENKTNNKIYHKTKKQFVTDLDRAVELPSFQYIRGLIDTLIVQGDTWYFAQIYMR